MAVVMVRQRVADPLILPIQQDRNLVDIEMSISERICCLRSLCVRGG